MRFVFIATLLAIASAVLVTLPRGDSEAAWPGDNGRIAYADLVNDGIWTMNPDGSDRIQLTTGSDTFPSWSPDGTRIAFRRVSEAAPAGISPVLKQIWIMDADGGNPQFLTIGDQPSWHPSGDSLVFVRENQEIWRIDADSSNENMVLGGELQHFRAPVYSPDGQYLAFSHVDLSGTVGEPSSAQGGNGFGPHTDIWAYNLTDLSFIQVTDTEEYGEFSSDWHPTQHRLVFETEGGIATADLNTAPAMTLIRPHGESEVREPAYSPDGTQIAYTNGLSYGFNTTIEVMNADGSDPQALQNTAGGEVTADWQPHEAETPTPTPSPTPSPTETPSPTPTPSPTATPAGPTPVTRDLVWADNNCSDEADPVDALLTLRDDAGLSVDTGSCPPMGTAIEVLEIAIEGLGEGDGGPQIWGDADCNESIDPVDALKILRYDAGLTVSQEEGCPPIGAGVTIQHAP